MRKIVAKVTLDNRVGIIEAHPESIDFMARYFTVMDTSACWVNGKFKRELAKPVCFITKAENNPTGAMIPIGLVPKLEKLFKENDATYKIIDTRKKEEWSFTDEEIKNVLYNEENNIKLRDYQIEGVRTLLAHKNGMFKAGTGGGKTEAISAWCKLTNKKTLIAFKNIKLAREIVARMKLAKIDVGLVQGNHVNENHQVVACTVQSAHKLNRTDYEAVIVDEAHNANQERYQTFLKRWDFDYRFGFSATPFNKKDRLKSLKVQAWLGDLIYDMPAKELVDKGHLAKPIITFIKVNRIINKVRRQKTEKLFDKQGNPVELPEFTQSDKWWFDNEVEDDNGRVIKRTRYWYEHIEKELDPATNWVSAERAGIVYNEYRNKMIKTLANNLSGTVLALVKYVESHGEQLHKFMDDALFLSGKDKVKDRELAVELLEANQLKTIIASTIFDEGVSVNNIANVLLCSGGAAWEKSLQRVGRGMRLNYDSEGNVIKNKVRVYDFYDETHPTLERHSKERIKYYKDEGYEVRIKEINLPDA
jgi:superfamily II DNA or RNA helicase